MTEKLSFGAVVDRITEALTHLDAEGQKVAMTTVMQLHGFQALPASSSLPLDDSPSQRGAALIDIKTLKDQKQPKTAIQMACVAAFYYQELAPAEERKNSISVVDIQASFRQAGFRLPKAARQLLPDAKAAGYFDSIGVGTYRLNAVGYNLVAHSLPQAPEKRAKKGKSK